MKSFRVWLALTGLVLTVQAWGEVTAPRVDNFLLLDQSGRAHELYYHSDAAAVVLLVHSEGCPMAQQQWAELQSVRAMFEGRGVRFMLIDSAADSDRQSVSEVADRLGIDAPILLDDHQLIGESLGLTVAGEVLVIDPETWQLVYRGPIAAAQAEADAQLSPPASLSAALARLLAGESGFYGRRQLAGCDIALPRRQLLAEHARISYVDEIAPLLLTHCVDCHQEGGIAPWAMSSYRMVRGFAPMIREVILTRRMPPMPLDVAVGDYVLTHVLPGPDRKTLVHWIEAGAPRGEGDDPLARRAPKPAAWQLGEPDLVIELPPFEVPASGVVDYQNFDVPIPIDRPVSVRAAQFMPGEPSVVHHSVNRVAATEAEEGRDRPPNNHLVTHVPGMEAVVYPEGTGVRLAPGAAVNAQMHYTPIGRPMTDRSRIGLWLHPEPPEFELLYHVLNGTVTVPPRVKEHTEQVYFTFPADAVIYRLFPHAHYRARSSGFRLRYPDGREEELLSVPNYDFNWQYDYELAHPLRVTAGTRIIHFTTYDNSPEKRGNPDPEITVEQGLLSEDEMLYGGMTYRYLNQEDYDRYNVVDFLELNNIVGTFDRDQSGGLDADEFDAIPNNNRLMRFAFRFLDADDDEEVGLLEWYENRWFRFLQTDKCHALCLSKVM